MSLREMQGLSLDQAPPVGVIFPFFLAAAAFATAAGVLLAGSGAAVLTSPFLPGTVAFTHLGTLGFLMMVMMGAIYQMIPVVIGVRVRGIRLAHAVFSAMVIGISALVAGLLLPSPAVVEAAIWLIGPAIMTFLVPTLWAVLRAPTKTETAHGRDFVEGQASRFGGRADRVLAIRGARGVELRSDEQARPRQERGIEGPQLLLDGRDRDLGFLLRHVGAVDQVDQHGGALDVAQELPAQALPLVGASDQAGDVGHHVALVVAPVHDAEVRNERREGIAGDLRSRRGDARDECRLACVRQAEQADVREQLELEPEPAIDAVLARL